MGSLTSIGSDILGEFAWIHDDDRREQMIANLTCSNHNAIIV